MFSRPVSQAARSLIPLIAVQPRFSTVRCKVLNASPLPCYPSPGSMVVRPVVLQDPPKHPFPAQLPFNNSSRYISPLESALTQVLILRHLKSFRMSTYTKTGGRDPLQSPKFVNSLRPPTTPKPTISATDTSPANPSLSISCGHFPSPIGVGVRRRRATGAADSPDPHPLPLFWKDVILKGLPGGVCKRCDSKGVTQTFPQLLFNRRWEHALPMPLLVQPCGPQLCQQRFRRNAQLLRCLGLIPLALAQRIFEHHFFDVSHGAAGHFLERSFPVELLRQHVRRNGAVVRLRRRQLQSIRPYRHPIGQNHRALQSVLQFAHVARPAIRKQTLFRFRGKLQPRLLELATEFFQKIFCQQQHIVSAVAQSWNRHRHRRHAEVQILAKTFFLYQFLQVAI